MKRRPWIVLLLVLILFLGACSSETSIELYEDEQWIVENVSDIDMSLMPDISVGGDILPGMGLDVGVDTGNWAGALMGGSLEELAPYYQDQGITFSWSERRGGGSTKVYTLRWEGQGWDTLQTVVLTGTQTTISKTGSNQVRFSMFVPNVDSELNYFMDNVIHVRGRQIIDANTAQITKKQATWNDPQGNIQAELELAKKFSLSTPLTILIALLVLGGITMGMFLLLRSPSPPRGRFNQRGISSRKRRQPKRRRSSRRRW